MYFSTALYLCPALWHSMSTLYCFLITIQNLIVCIRLWSLFNPCFDVGQFWDFGHDSFELGEVINSNSSWVMLQSHINDQKESKVHPSELAG